MCQHWTGPQYREICKSAEASTICCVNIDNKISKKAISHNFQNRAQFLDDVRSVMGLAEWMLNIDSRKTKTIHGDACIQLFIHFKGPKAHQMDLDFSRLISTGRLDSPTISTPGFVNQKRKTKLSYKSCGVRDPNEKKKPRKTLLSLSSGMPKVGSSIVLTLGVLTVAKLM